MRRKILAISDCGRTYLFICVHGLPFPGKIVGLMRTKRKSTIIDDAIPFDVGLCLPIPSSCGGSVWKALALAGGDLVDEDEGRTLASGDSDTFSQITSGSTMPPSSQNLLMRRNSKMTGRHGRSKIATKA